MSKEVAVKEEMTSELLLSMNFGDIKDGFSGKVDASTSTIPFLKLLQDLSPECKKKGGEYVEGAEVGLFLNSLTKRIYGESVKIIPVFFEPMYCEWKPERGGFAGRHTIAEASALTVSKEFGKWQTPEGNLLVETFMYYFLLPDFIEDGLVAVSMSSSSLKSARLLNTLVERKYFPKTAKKAPSFVQVYNMSALEASNKKGTWYQPKFTFDSFVTPDVASMAVDMLKSLRSGDIKADFSQMDGDAGYDASSDADVGDAF